ncbi:MAG TPA: dihydrodipicolinate synthase family protein [Terriglobales bacterium]|jgi:4-hydroxy-tetrahydrodipicolinate synthase|nr:dihydrodipicolinate synthase family protein [Terriglobales bacterium]
MQTTRRTFLGSVGATAALGMVGAGTMVEAKGGTSAAMQASSAAKNKCLFWVAALTPCDKNLKFDESVYAEMMAYFKAAGADGVVVLGTTGEYPSFSVAERKRVAEVAFKHRNGLNIIVSPGTSNFPETIELSQHAADNGADGLLIIPPFYYKNPPLEGLVEYFSLIFEQVKIPINLYHIPDTSGVPISIELLRSLKKYPNLAGIKDSDDSVPDYQRFVNEFPSLNMRTGTVTNLKAALDHDMGAILMEGNLFTRQIAAVFAAKRADKSLDEPLAKLDAAIKLLDPAGGYHFGTMKYALSLQMGTRQTYPRPPHTRASDEQMGKMQAALQQMKQLG